MAVLVTGGSGFIGSHVVDKLMDSGTHVIVFDVIKPHRSDVEFIKGNITSFDELNAAMKDIDYVYHIAALSNINKVAQEPLKAIDLNILSTGKVLEAACKSNVKRVIFASTYFINGMKGHLYTTCKAASEMICKDYFTLYGLPFTILRYGTAYGPRSRGEDVISLFIQKAFANQPLEIHGSGAQSRNFIYVEDLAWGNVAALSPVAKNKIYILQGSCAITIRDIANLINRLFDGKLDIRFGPNRTDDNGGENILDNSYKELNWEPQIDIEEGIKKYIKWYIKNK